MTEDDKKLASLKLLRESSAWMVGVQTAIFGFLVTLLNAGQLKLGSVMMKGAITSFAISIVFAGIVLGAIPWTLSRHPLPGQIRSAPIADWPIVRLVTLGWASATQFSAFVVGICLLSASVLDRQFG